MTMRGYRCGCGGIHGIHHRPRRRRRRRRPRHPPEGRTDGRRLTTSSVPSHASSVASKSHIQRHRKDPIDDLIGRRRPLCPRVRRFEACDVYQKGGYTLTVCDSKLPGFETHSRVRIRIRARLFHARWVRCIAFYHPSSRSSRRSIVGVFIYYASSSRGDPWMRGWVGGGVLLEL
jgi:hypothetical protein